MKIFRHILSLLKTAIVAFLLLVILAATVFFIRAHRFGKHLHQMTAQVHTGMNAREFVAVFPEDYFTGWIQPVCKDLRLGLSTPEDDAELKLLTRDANSCDKLASVSLNKRADGEIPIELRLPDRPPESTSFTQDQLANFLDTKLAGTPYIVSFTYLTPTPQHVTFRVWFSAEGKVSKVVKPFGWD